MELLHKDLTEKLIGIFYEVYNELGHGFLEKVYQNAMYIELKSQGYDVMPQKQIKVHYKGNEVGEYYSDLIIRPDYHRVKSKRMSIRRTRSTTGKLSPSN